MERKVSRRKALAGVDLSRYRASILRLALVPQPITITNVATKEYGNFREEDIPLLILGTGDIGNSRLGSVNVDSMISLLSIQPNLKICIVSRKSRNFSAVQTQNMIHNCFNGFLSEIRIVNSQIAIKPACLSILAHVPQTQRRMVHMILRGKKRDEGMKRGRRHTSVSTNSVGIKPFARSDLTTFCNCSSFPKNLVSWYPVFSYNLCPLLGKDGCAVTAGVPDLGVREGVVLPCWASCCCALWDCIPLGRIALFGGEGAVILNLGLDGEGPVESLLVEDIYFYEGKRAIY